MCASSEGYNVYFHNLCGYNSFNEEMTEYYAIFYENKSYLGSWSK